MDMNKLILHSGGMDSLACMLKYISDYGEENIISLGFNYGQRHFNMENAAAEGFCKAYNIPRKILNVDIAQIGGCSLIDLKKEVTQDMTQQRSTVVPQRNAIFLLFAAAFAQENDCDEIVHGACAEDFIAYRDCRKEFFESIEKTIQAGRTQPIHGSEHFIDDIVDGNINPDKIDIKISTPFLYEKKQDTLKKVVEKWGINVYKLSYTCYNGEELSCGKCPACCERIEAFKINGLTDPIYYKV